MFVILMWDDQPDGTKTPGTWLNSKSDDFVVVWREWGDEHPNGYRTHVLAQGIYEGVTFRDVDNALIHLEPRLE